ncbi:hypothetical protein U062_02147 [Gammaproteobacteria bacterium MOLA455]|nr:hypothetical protein U062_02147 [Gammaproteobacteria bacterium MOLA455]
MSENLVLPMVPELPSELENAAKDGRLVLFVGAGASMLVGMPSWQELATCALSDLVKIKEIDYGEKHQLSELDPKKQLSIADQIARDAGMQLELGDHLVPNRDSKIYEVINSIGAVSVTTNYDHELAPIPKIVVKGDETPSTVRRISGAENLGGNYLREPGTVIHLHGDKDDSRNMIVTTKDYLDHYDHPKVAHFLMELFKHNVVLFLGYGLKESEILEHILRRSGARKDVQERRRFTLQPFLSKQRPLCERLVTYYEETFGVHLIGYNIDAIGYDQLERVMISWADKLSVRPLSLVDEMAVLDEVIANE